LASNFQRIRHKRSAVKGKRPTADILTAGEISINYNNEEPGLFITTSNETIAKIGPTAIGSTAPNTNPPSGGYGLNSNGELWFNSQDRVMRIYNESTSQWEEILSPIAGSSTEVINVSQNSDQATDALSNDGKTRPFKTIQRALLQVVRETIQKDPSVEDPNYAINIVNGKYSVPNKGTTLGSPTLEITSSVYGDSTNPLVTNGTATITFTFSTTPAAFTSAMIAVKDGTITAPVVDANSPNTFTATFTRLSTSDFGTITVSDGAYTDLNGLTGLGDVLSLASSTGQAGRIPLGSQSESYEPTDTDYEFLNVNEGLIIPKGTSINGLSQRSVYVTGNYNSKSQDRTGIFKVSGNSLIQGITVIDKQETNTVLPDDTKAALNQLTFAEPHGLRTGDSITFSPVSGGRIYSPLIYGRAYQINKVDDYTVTIAAGSSIVSLVSGTSSNTNGIIASYTVSRDNLSLNNVHAFEFVSDAELTEYYTRVSSDLLPTVSTYTVPEVWEAEIVAPTTDLEVDSVRKASAYFSNIAVRSKYGMSGWLLDGAKTTGLKSAHLSDCTVVSLQTSPDCWEVYNSATNTWATPLGNTIDEQRQAIIDAPLNEIRIKVPRLPSGQVDETDDCRFFGVHATNNAYCSAFSCYTIGTSDHYLTTAGGYISVHSSTSNFGGVGLAAEGFSGVGTTSGALEQDTGWFVEGFLRPLKVDLTEAADQATSINLGVAITEILQNDGVSTDPRLTSDNIAVGETAFYLDKPYAATVPLPFSLVPSTAIYAFVSQSYYRALLTANPFITDANGAIIGFRTSSTSNAIFDLGTAAVNEDIYIRRFVDSRTDAERNPQILIQGKDQRPPQLNQILRLTSGGRGTNGTQLIKSGVQIDPVLTNDPAQVFEVVDFSTKELGLNPNELLKSFNNIFAPTNEYFITVQRDGEFGAWAGGTDYVRGDLVSYNGKNYIASSPNNDTEAPTTSPYWLNAQTSLPDITYVNSISSIGIVTNVINKDDGSRSMGITDDDLNPTFTPTQRAIRSFMNLLGVSAANQLTVLRPETRANRLFTVSDMLTAGMQVTGAGYATELGTWPIEFNRPSTISAISHSWDLCGYWNYSTALPQKQDSQLTKRESLDYLSSEKSGGLVFANGMTEDNEFIFASPYRDIYAGGLYDIRQDQNANEPFVVSAEFDSLKEVYYQNTAPVASFLGTIWIDSSVTPNVVNYWDGTVWVAIGGGADSFNGRTGAIIPAEGDYTTDLLGDVDTTTTAPVAGQVLKYDGVNWVPAADDDTVYVLPTSTETVVGGAEIATQAETDAGADNTRIVSPAKLAAFKTNVLDAAYAPAAAAGVTSFNTRIGAIVPLEGDYTLDLLGDVDTTTVAPVAGQVLKYNGVGWAPAADTDTIYVLPASSETVVGGAEIATQAETDAGADNTRIVSPAKLSAYKANVLDVEYAKVVAAPGTSGDPGNAGEVAYDANFFYWYDGAAWQRVAADATVW